MRHSRKVVMRKLFDRRSLLCGILVMGLLTFTGIASGTVTQNKPNIYWACVPQNGSVRIIYPGTSCKLGERLIKWNQTGATGAKGATGSAGNAGATSGTGTAGQTGNTGSQGPAGNDGATGSTGSQGPAGNNGAAGSTGSQGPAGNNGATGSTGSQGPAGNNGAAGSTGSQGPAGNNGAAGSTGSQGPAGNTGSQGNIGPAGSNGVSGYAYYYNLTPQTVAIEADVLFDTNGVDSPVPIATHTPGSSMITVASTGTYKVSFIVSATEPGQIAVFLNGAPVLGSIYGSGAGTQQNTGQVILSALSGRRDHRPQPQLRGRPRAGECHRRHERRTSTPRSCSKSSASRLQHRRRSASKTSSLVLGAFAVDLQAGVQVDRHAVRITKLSVALPPEGVPRLLLAFEAGSHDLRVRARPPRRGFRTRTRGRSDSRPGASSRAESSG